MRFLSTFFFFTSVILGYCQSSITNLLDAFQSNPEDKEVLIDLANYYKTESIDSVNYFCDLLIDLAEKNHNEELRLQAILKKVEVLILFNNYKIADSLINSITFELDPNPLSVAYLMADGRILNNKGENDEALKAFYLALEYTQTIALGDKIPEIYADIAAVLRENNDLENCTKYYRFALEKAGDNSDVELQVKVCIQMCKVYNGWITVDLDSSVYYGELGMKIAQEANYEYGYANAISILAAPIIRNGDFKRGLDMSREALTYADEYNFSLRTRYFLVLNQGFAFQELGIYDSASVTMEEAAELRPVGYDHFRLKYLIHKSQKQFAQALEALEIYRTKADSSLRKRNASKLSSVQAKFEANLREQEIASLTQTATLQELQLSQKNYFLGGLGVLTIFLMIGALLLYRQRQLKQQQEITSLELKETQKRLELEQQYRASELKALRSQMNPHFVFNALNSIQEYIMTNEKKLAGKYLGKFADLMRIYLQHSQVKTISLRAELEALELYLELEKLRFEDSLLCEIDTKNEVDDETPIPSLLIQPYVENAIKHGLLHKKKDKKLKISVSKDEDTQMLICKIIDNGIGRRKSQEINKMRFPNHKSFATEATKSRLHLLNFDRSDPIEEEIIDLLNKKGESIGTEVRIKIPIEGAWETQNGNSEVE